MSDDYEMCIYCLVIWMFVLLSACIILTLLKVYMVES